MSKNLTFSGHKGDHMTIYLATTGVLSYPSNTVALVTIILGLHGYQVYGLVWVPVRLGALHLHATNINA